MLSLFALHMSPSTLTKPSPVRVLRTEITSLQDKLEHAEFKAACLEKQNATSVRFTGTLDDYTRHLEEEVGSLQMQLRDAWAKWDRGRRMSSRSANVSH